VRSLVDKAVLPTSLVLGGFVSLCEFACSGGVYVGILILLSTKERHWEGILYLILYNLVFVAPLVVILILGTQAENLVKMDRWRVINRRRMKTAAGIFMIILGIATYYYMFT
jgi:cytochrome c-type biogenesis protein